MPNWTKEQEELFWNKNLVPYVVESNPRKFAPQILEKLQEEGNKIFIITENQTNALREEINMADYKKNGNRCGGYDR